MWCSPFCIHGYRNGIQWRKKGSGLDLPIWKWSVGYSGKAALRQDDRKFLFQSFFQYGYEEGGQLTEAVRRAPYSVILFDEIEKAHEDVFNMFLQILDDGRLTDNKGNTVDFKNTIIIMTSNIGSSYLLQDQGKITEETKGLVMGEMKRRFKPEFLNRVDDIIMFKSLDKEEIKKIIDIFMNSLANRLKDKDINMEVTDAAKDIMVREGYDPVYGARPLKRYIGNTLETIIARKLIAGQIRNGDTIVVDGDGDNIDIVVK